MKIKEQIFKLTFRKYDGFEGLLASYLLTISIVLSLFINKTITNEIIAVPLFILLGISGLSFITSLIYVLFFRLDNKSVLENLQFISWFNTSALTVIYFISVLANYNFLDLNLIQLALFLVALFYLLSSLSIVIYYIIFWIELEGKFSRTNHSSKLSFFDSDHLKTVSIGTFKEKNLLILLAIFVFANYYFFKRDNSFISMYETFIFSFFIYNIISIIRSRIR